MQTIAIYFSQQISLKYMCRKKYTLQTNKLFNRWFFFCYRYVYRISLRAIHRLFSDRAILTSITYVCLHVYIVLIFIMNEVVAYTLCSIRWEIAHICIISLSAILILRTLSARINMHILQLAYFCILPFTFTTRRLWDIIVLCPPSRFTL